MIEYPAVIANGFLYLITSDNQLLSIDIASGKIGRTQNAYEILKQKFYWCPSAIERNYIKLDYPDKFLLPYLQNGKTIEQGLAEHITNTLYKNLAIGSRDTVYIEIYFLTLLINKEGKCELVSTMPSCKKGMTDKDYIDSKVLEYIIDDWIKKQTFKTNTFPEGFHKFKYESFVYLK